MNRLITALSAAALSFAMVGCEDKPTAPAPAPSQPESTPAPAPAPAAETPAPVEAPAPAAASTGSAGGTVELFIASMQKRDYDTALTCLDPSSEGFKQIGDVNNTIKTNDQIPPDAVELVKNFLSSGFVGMTHKDLMEEGDRARVTLVPKDGAPITVDMNRLDGKWLIIAPANIVQAKAPPAPPPTPMPLPAPVPGPTGQK